jgi:hypothetical protein
MMDFAVDLRNECSVTTTVGAGSGIAVIVFDK